VRKRDGKLRFCMDYHRLNLIRKADKFLLLRIDDLLDQLGKAKYFSILDLAAGHWQIRVNENLQLSRLSRGYLSFELCPLA